MTKTLSVRVSDETWDEFHRICFSRNITVQEMLHACVVDVLWESKDVQRREQEGHTGSGEAAKDVGATEA